MNIFIISSCFKPSYLDPEASALEIFANGSNDADDREHAAEAVPEAYPTTASKG